MRWLKAEWVEPATAVIQAVAAALALGVTIHYARVANSLLEAQNASQVDPQVDLVLAQPDRLLIMNTGVHPVVDLSITCDYVLMADTQPIMVGSPATVGEIAIALQGPMKLEEGAHLGTFVVPPSHRPGQFFARIEPRQSRSVSLHRELEKAARDAEATRTLRPTWVAPEAEIASFVAITVTYHRAIDHRRYVWTQEVLAVGGPDGASLIGLQSVPEELRSALRGELRRWRSATRESSGTAVPE